jgi:hypothetical protein
MLLYSENRRSLFFIFFVYFLLEVFLGGSGGLLKYDTISLRKVNFVIALGLSALLYFFRKKINTEIIWITFIFLALLFFHSLVGFINYSNYPGIYENFFMQSFFLVLPFYALFIRQKKDVELIIKLMRFASVFLAAGYLILFSLLVSGAVSYVSVYTVLMQSDEFLGRGIGFWYKGFLYMCIGIFFFGSLKNSWVKILSQIAIFFALIFTFVRGFIIALLGTDIFFNFFYKSKLRSAIIIVLGVLAFAYLSAALEEASFNRDQSNLVRVEQFHQVMSAVTPVSFFIGHGFGKGVLVRENHMEINYLEIFHKEGIIGLLFWLFLLAYVIFIYTNINRFNSENEIFARPFLLSTLFVYIESATNPFLTNSIGMNIVLITIVALKVLRKDSYVQDLSSNGNL